MSAFRAVSKHGADGRQLRILTQPGITALAHRRLGLVDEPLCRLHLTLRHEGLGSTALSGGDLLHGPSGSYRAVLRQQCVGVSFLLVPVMMLDEEPVVAISAAEVEAAVIDQLRIVLRSPEIVVATWRQVREADPEIPEAEVRDALHQFDALWDELFPAEQARIFQLLVERIDVGVDSLQVRLRAEGLVHLYEELAGPAETRKAA